MEKEISLSQQVYEKIKEGIINQTYPAGTALTEAKLADEFNVSKTPVKSAINRLINEDWLESGFRKKVYVKAFTEKQLIEYYKFRRILEKSAIEEIFETGQNWVYSFKLEAALLDMKANAKDFFAFESADARLHNTLISVFDNEKILRVYNDLNDELVRVNVFVYQHNVKKDLEYAKSIISELESFILAVREEKLETALHFMLDVHMKRGLDEALEAIHKNEMISSD